MGEEIENSYGMGKEERWGREEWKVFTYFHLVLKGLYAVLVGKHNG